MKTKKILATLLSLAVVMSTTTLSVFAACDGSNHTYEGATCITTGRCTCGAEGRDLTNHTNLQEVEGKDPTCTESGYTAHRECLDCGYTVGKETILARHTWGDWETVTEATCNSVGSKTRECTVEECNTFETAEIPIDENAHNYGGWTSNGDGTHNRTCSHNNAHTETGDCDRNGVDNGCSICGYGATPTEPVGCDHKSTPREYEPNGDGTHDVICYECGETIDENVACTGGEATCMELAVCSYCVGEYGEFSDHDFSECEWINDTQHCTICADCGTVEEDSEEDCTYNEGKCTVCGRTDPDECEHDEGELLCAPNDNGTHDFICDTCGKTTEENVKCEYGDDNVCDDCGYEKSTSSGGSSSSGSSSSGSSGSSSSSSSTTTKPAVDTKAETDKIAKAEEGSNVSVKIEGTTVPADYIKTAMESKATVVVDYGSYAWEISDVKTAKAVDLSINTSARYLVEQGALKALKGDNSNVIDIAHDGKLGFKGTLKYNVDKKNAGKFVNLYYYNSTTKKLELQGSTKIGADGNVFLPFTHCSTYVLNITDKAASNELFEDFSAGESATVVEDTLPAATNAPAATEAPATTDAAANPETGNSAAALMAIPMAIAAAAIISKKR